MGKKSTRELSPDEFYAQLKKQREKPKATIIAGVILLLFLAAVFFLMPPQLPWLIQKIVGVVNALLVLLVAMFAVKEYGKKVPALARQKIDVGLIGGGALAALVFGWWLTPFAPIKVGMPGADEVARLLSEELTLAVLVMPDTLYALIEPPTPPPQAALLARQISSDSDPYSRLIKAIAEKRFIEAPSLVEQAESSGADPAKLAIVRGQLEVYAGRFSESLPHFEKAVGAGDDVSAASQQAVALALSGNVDAAYQAATRLLESARSGESATPNALGISLNLKAAMALISGRFKEAVTLCEESQLSWEATPDSAHKAASRNNQAVVYAMLPKKFTGAETQFDGALALWRDLYGLETAHIASSRNNLGVLALAQVRFVEAEKHLNESVRLARSNFATDSLGLFSPLNAMARFHTLLGRYHLARPIAEESAKLAANSPLLEVSAAATRGSLLAGEGKYRDSAGGFARALTLSKSTLLPEHIFLADIRSHRAAVNSLQGRFADTAAECKAVIEIVEAQLGDNHPLAARTSNTWGLDLVRAGKKPEARKHFERAQSIVAATKSEIPQTPDAAVSLAGLSQLYAKREWRNGIDNLRDAVKIDAEVFGPVLGKPADEPIADVPSTASYLFDEAMLYTTNGSSSDYDRALQLFETVLRIREKLLPPAHPERIATYEGFATLLKKMDRTEQAEAMDKKAEQLRAASEKRD